MTRKIQTGKLFRLFFLLLTLILSKAALAQTTAFTYQGKLTDAGNPANSNYDLQFKLFDALAGGVQQGAVLDRFSVTATAGVFTVTLDFGANVFSGADRYLEIGVRPANTTNAYTVLAPRQPILSVPYAIQSLSATTATTAVTFSGSLAGDVTGTQSATVLANNAVTTAKLADGNVTDDKIATVAGSKVTGTIPVAGVPAGSANYIQNSIAQQASANFNISGSGTTGNLNVNSAFSLGGSVPPAAAPAGQGRIYFDSATNKVKVSENGAAFVNLVGAGGVSGSGTVNSIPLWSAGTTLGTSQITQSAAGVQLPTQVQLAVSPQGNQLVFGTPNTETGMTIAGVSGRADLRYDGTLKLVNGPGGIPSPTNGIAITTAGNVGIGTTAPTTKLFVLSSTAGVSAIYGESATGRGVWGKSTSSRGVYGESTSLEGVYGISSSGNGVSGASTTGSGVYGQTAVSSLTAGGVYGKGIGNDSLGVIGESNSGDNAVGVYGVTSSLNGIGMFARNSAAGGRAFYADGNAAQLRDKGGLVKAMVYVNQDGTIARCYNGQTNSSTGNCGFDVTYQMNGRYLVDFHFQVTDRLLSLAPRGSYGSTTGLRTATGANFYFTDISITSNTQVLITTFVIEADTAFRDAAFMLIVY